MKSFIFTALLMAFGVTLAAAEIPLKLKIYGNKANTTMADGIITVANTDAKAAAGVHCDVNINQTAPAKIVLSGESKCIESLTKGKNSHDYSLYVDLTFQDGTKKYGFITPFSTADKEWQKKSVVINQEKPVRQVRIYVLYRFQTGKVQFRNLKLEEVK